MEKNNYPIGWWIVTAPNGEVWHTERFPDDTIEKAEEEALATFGEGATVREGQ